MAGKYKSPLFQKKHYEAIAEVIAKTNSNGGGVYDLTVELSRMFNRGNSNYDPGKFYVACKIHVSPEEPAPQEEPTVKVNHLDPINWGELRAVRRRDE